jgi:hypothetical protein
MSNAAEEIQSCWGYDIENIAEPVADIRNFMHLMGNPRSNLLQKSNPRGFIAPINHDVARLKEAEI